MNRSDPSLDFRQKVIYTTKVIVATGLALALLISTSGVFLLLFAGILIAVFLRGCGDWLAQHTPLRPGWAALAVVVGFVILAAGVNALIIPNAVGEMGDLGPQLSSAVEKVQTSLEQSSVGQQVLRLVPNPTDVSGQATSVLDKARGIFSTTVGALASFFVMLFIGFYLAANPGAYTRGVVQLFPHSRRRRAREVLTELQITLTRWMLGRLIGVVVIGVATWIGLTILGIPLALTLGLMAAVLSIIPNIGPVLSVVPAILFAFVQDPHKVLWVLAIYAATQALETYLLTPLVARRAVALPPVLTIVVQIILGIYFGIIGLLLAGPLAAALLVLVKMLYLEDTLGEDVALPSDGQAAAAEG